MSIVNNENADKLWSLFKAYIDEYLLSKNDIDIQDLASKSKNVFGSKNESNTGVDSATTYRPGLVPSSAITYTRDKYLKGDGTWAAPLVVRTGYTNSPSSTSGSNYNLTFSGNFTGVRDIEIFAPDGTLAFLATVDPTYKITQLKAVGYFQSITADKLVVYVGVPNLTGRWFYIAHAYDV